MAVVVGQIEPLKKLKEKLNANGITRFNSIGEIKNFIKNYESEKKATHKIVERKLEEEINELQSSFVNKQKILDRIKSDIINESNKKIINLEELSKKILEKRDKNLINRLFYNIKIKNIYLKKSKIKKKIKKIIHKKTYYTELDLVNAKSKLDNYKEYKEKIITARCEEAYKELESTKEIIDGLYTLIAGAIGENSVINEIRKLSDSYYLINDFSKKFKPPIYNKKEKDRISSMQIDHLLISQSGLFLIETKNWSKKSVQNIDLRSPVEQILRTSYALFILLNSESKFNKISLSGHHWGSKKIPIRNLIVMTNEKPKQEFKHVKVLSLKELNGYIQFFDQIFNQAEVENIFNYLNNQKIYNT